MSNPSFHRHVSTVFTGFSHELQGTGSTEISILWLNMHNSSSPIVCCVFLSLCICESVPLCIFLIVSFKFWQFAQQSTGGALLNEMRCRSRFNAQVTVITAEVTHPSCQPTPFWLKNVTENCTCRFLFRFFFFSWGGEGGILKQARPSSSAELIRRDIWMQHEIPNTCCSRQSFGWPCEAHTRSPEGLICAASHERTA